MHSISHMVGGLYDTPHGLTNAIILPAVLKYNKPKLESKIKQIASACGAKTEKMKFGHHGANHPVQELKSHSVLITSQNHGFSVSEDSLPKVIAVSYTHLTLPTTLQV